MLNLPKPEFTVEEVFKLSISKVRDVDLKNRLEACIPEIVRDTLDYNTKAGRAQLHQIQKKTHVNGNVKKDEMKAVYNNRLVRGPGRYYYNKLKNPINGDDRCPFCGEITAQTLDHYLPKTDYPSLAVSPTNLIPACRDCNSIKSSASPTKSEEEALHPYFDNINDKQWLFAKVIQPSTSLRYFIQPPPDVDPLFAERVKYHFKLYELNRLYSSKAAQELRNIAYQMKKLFHSGGRNAVQLQLLERAESSFHASPNSWRAAMYQALAADEWYCSRGVSMDMVREYSVTS